MKKKNAFTLVELLAVIVIIGLLLAIALPASLKLAGNVKKKAYDTKIELIEQAASSYGQTNLAFVRTGMDIENTSSHHTCKLQIEGDTIKGIDYIPKTYSESASLSENEYWCIRTTVEDLIGSHDLEYDEKDVCLNCSTDEEKKNYNDIVINPHTNNIINQCYVYVYYKYNRVYTTFDKAKCDVVSNTPTLGQEYPRLRK